MSLSDPIWHDGIQGLLFDLDGTLYPLKVVRRKMMLCVLAELLRHPIRSRPITTIRIIQTFRRMREALRDRPPGAKLADLQFTQVAEALALPETLVRSTVQNWMFDRAMPTLRAIAPPGQRAALLRLKASGLRLGVLSDYPVAQKLEALGLGEGVFELAMATVDPAIDAFKPNPEGLLLCAERLGLAPSAMAYVGDRTDADVEGARRAGMTPVLLTGDRIDAQPVDGSYHATRTVCTLAEEFLAHRSD